MKGKLLQVYKGVYDQSTEVAIKHLKYETQKDMDEALFEVAILKKQLHPNILQFLGASIGVGPSSFSVIQCIVRLKVKRLLVSSVMNCFFWHFAVIKGMLWL